MSKIKVKNVKFPPDRLIKRRILRVRMKSKNILGQNCKNVFIPFLEFILFNLYFTSNNVTLLSKNKKYEMILNIHIINIIQMHLCI